MKKTLSISIFLLIATIFPNIALSQHYVKIIKDTESLKNKEKYKSGKILPTQIDSAKSCYIHIIKVIQQYARNGVQDGSIFLITKWHDNPLKVHFNDNAKEDRCNCYTEGEILVKVGEDFFKKDAIEFISKSEYDSIQKIHINPIKNDTARSDSLKVPLDTNIPSDSSESSNEIIIGILAFLVGIIVCMVGIFGVPLAHSYFNKKKDSDKDKTNSSQGVPSSSPSEDKETPIVTVPKLSWREKLGCFLAKDILERNEAQINKLNECKEQNSETIDELKKQIEDKDKEANEHTEKIQQLQNDNKKLKDEELPNYKASGRQEENDAILEKIKSKFDWKEVMTIDEALKKLAEEIKNYKDKVTEAENNVTQKTNSLNSEYDKKKKELDATYSKRKTELETNYQTKEKELKKEVDTKLKEVEDKQKSADKRFNDAQMLLDEAEKRVKEIEASDKGVLVTQLEQLQGVLDEKSQDVATHEAHIKNLKTEIEGNKKQISNLQSKLSDEQKAHEATKDKNKAEREQLKVSHKAELKDKELECQNRISQLKDEHQNELTNINDAHQNELKKKDEHYLSEITQEKQKAEDRETKLKDVISSQKSSISELEEKLQIESDLLRNEAVQIAETLCQFLKDNEIMAACDDDYKDKVEEKLQDVVYEAEQMYQAIKGLPQTKTPSEWVETLTKLLTQQMEENTSLLNRVLKYYAMSNVPFMIDSERGNGIYFIRKHMSQAYDYINSILAQCGIVPIIPAAFVENKDEGHYEVEGQFNDIESFCPGNMSEHLEHIERSSQSQSDMIIGITRVGYIIKNKKIIKAQVITK